MLRDHGIPRGPDGHGLRGRSETSRERPDDGLLFGTPDDRGAHHGQEDSQLHQLGIQESGTGEILREDDDWTTSDRPVYRKKSRILDKGKEVQKRK